MRVSLVRTLGLYVLLYKARLIPRWLSLWGIVAIESSVVAAAYGGFTQEFGIATVNTVLNIPIGLQEVVLAVWLVARGFDRSAPAAGTGSPRVAV
jgi:hypothetical protein